MKACMVIETQINRGYDQINENPLSASLRFACIYFYFRIERASPTQLTLLSSDKTAVFRHQVRTKKFLPLLIAKNILRRECRKHQR